jgi:asparagine synthase (glutamine-hydrolysing)
MCGICGIVNLDGGAADAGLLVRMLGTVRHRGPDGSGVHADGPAGLGHVRLSIIDPDGGRQPMANEDGSLWVTFNGEIFNFVELMADLKGRGHRFATRSDTEVILHAYEEFGEDCVRHFNGQWAFALWDGRRRKLFLSRDRFGVRPLFYTRAAGQFLFASEVKALLAHPAVRRRLDLFALDQVFTLWAPIPPRTVFQDVRELPPGHSLALEAGVVRTWRYWRPDFVPHPQRRAEADWAEELLGLLADATRLRLRADVPVGAYLSGGLDSSLTTALVKRFTPAAVRTFSVTFDDPALDESGYQQEVARFLGTEHQSVRCGHADIAAVFPEVVRHAERPVLRTAPAPLYLLSGLVRQRGYKVVVTGEGADEVFGGYDIFKEAKVRRFWAAQPGSRLRPLLLRRLYPYLADLQAQPEAYRQAFFQVAADDRADPFLSHRPRWDLTSRLKLFFAADVRAALQGYDPRDEVRALLPEDFGRWDALSRAQYLETAYLLPGYILSSQGDRVAMAHAVEGRFPFLDHRVAEFAWKMPPRLRMRGLQEKHILRRIADGLVPASVRERPKQPYRAPDARSFFGSPEAPVRCAYADELLSRERVHAGGVFDAAAVEKLVHKARRGAAASARDNMALVGVLSTQLLIDQLIDRSPERNGEPAAAEAVPGQSSGNIRPTV